jgi:hypothetical protein
MIFNIFDGDKEQLNMDIPETGVQDRMVGSTISEGNAIYA